MRRFSPHTRGCSQIQRTGIPFQYVFPAYAGMFRLLPAMKNCIAGFPRIRGDVPHYSPLAALRRAFSPHTRGCSERILSVPIAPLVFPAYAGMFPTAPTICATWGCFPRIRGDVPINCVSSALCMVFSPHTRGCSYASSGATTALIVFPAYAGMFRSAFPPSRVVSGFPRIRGDVPHGSVTATRSTKFSPHTRGCSFSNA